MVVRLAYLIIIIITWYAVYYKKKLFLFVDRVFISLKSDAALYRCDCCVNKYGANSIVYTRFAGKIMFALRRVVAYSRARIII